MIAARLAGGNLFLAFLWWGKITGRGFLEHSEHSDFFVGDSLGGDFVVGVYWSTRSGSEHSDFFEGIFLWGILFLGGVVGWVLD